MSAWRSLMVVSLLLLAGCNYVKPTEKAATVRVGSAADVVNCQRQGQTTVSTLARIAGLPRYESSIRDELNTLARNSAANMGGDTVVPASPAKDGTQTFTIYRCRP
ncbi:MAG TPA: DUF4156 domain-containing protein [Gammaproteobacteria bacterium]